MDRAHGNGTEDASHVIPDLALSTDLVAYLAYLDTLTWNGVV